MSMSVSMSVSVSESVSVSVSIHWLGRRGLRSCHVVIRSDEELSLVVSMSGERNLQQLIQLYRRAQIVAALVTRKRPSGWRLDKNV